MNAVARAQLTFQILHLLQKYLYRQSQCSETWHSKRLALIAQQVRAFGMNPKVWGSSSPKSRHFLSQKLWHFHKNSRSCVQNECCSKSTDNISSVNFTFKNTFWLELRHSKQVWSHVDNKGAKHKAWSIISSHHSAFLQYSKEHCTFLLCPHQNVPT